MKRTSKFVKRFPLIVTLMQVIISVVLADTVATLFSQTWWIACVSINVLVLLVRIECKIDDYQQHKDITFIKMEDIQ